MSLRLPLAAALTACCIAFLVPAAHAATKRPIDFNRDIRPVLSDNCFYCHGPDPKTREAGLRLDTFEGATAVSDGKQAIVPGSAARSEVIRRITTTDADDLMPPPDSHKKLTPAQIAAIRQWIDDGARYQGHWAYEPIRRPQAPKVNSTWPRGDIDRFILARLEAEGLQPAAEADRRTLIRRLSFDLTGLPPTPAEVDAFLADKDPRAYENLVDRLLSSPAYGERMAMWWLDLARYADSVGYHGDQEVKVWPFRDYVIRAFNDNMPFDRFTAEQLGGDLLEKPTRDQLIASGFNRLGMMSAEGGVQDKEYLAKYAAERVRNLGGVWLGATTGCAECHDHKFDPWSTKQFYSFQAFYADIKEKGLYGGSNVSGKWGSTLLLTNPEQQAKLAAFDEQVAGVKKQVDAALPDAKKKLAAWEKELRQQNSAGQRPKLPGPIFNILFRNEAQRRTAREKDELLTYYLEQHHPDLAKLSKQLAAIQKERDAYEATIPSTLYVEATEPRTIRVLPRGNWMDDSGEIVRPEFPAFLAGGGAASTDRRLNRLDLAHWLMSPDNPLPARVTVNRLWAMFFGVGISRKLEDFGAQGEPPVHPELLDHLARLFIESGWNFKQTIRAIVTSAAYRQSSVGESRAVELDPDNRLYSRQGRFRLPAEMIRDNALATSGLLVRTMYGRSVRPYQPPGYYAQLNFPKREYEVDTGDNLWRRSLYTHWQRTFLHPALQAFDAPSREECTAERVRSNTPLQSLVLLNDPQFVEAARALAERIVREGGGDEAGRLEFAMKTVLSRGPTDEEAKLLLELHGRHLRQFSREKESAGELLKIGARPADPALDTAQVAAWTSVARTLLNLHETITRD